MYKIPALTDYATGVFLYYANEKNPDPQNNNIITTNAILHPIIPDTIRTPKEE